MEKYTIFYDFACPYCYIGIAIANRFKNENEDVKLRFVPYELNPSTDLREGRAVLNNIQKEQMEFAYKRIKRLGDEYDLEFNNKERAFNTNKALRVALYAQEQGKFFPYALETFKRIFKLGENVSDLEVLYSIGEAVGIEALEINNVLNSQFYEDEMQNAINLSNKSNIESVPTFIRGRDNKHITLLKAYSAFEKDLIL